MYPGYYRVRSTVSGYLSQHRQQDELHQSPHDLTDDDVVRFAIEIRRDKFKRATEFKKQG